MLKIEGGAENAVRRRGSEKRKSQRVGKFSTTVDFLLGGKRLLAGWRKLNFAVLKLAKKGDVGILSGARRGTLG